MALWSQMLHSRYSQVYVSKNRFCGQILCGLLHENTLTSSSFSPTFLLRLQGVDDVVFVYDDMYLFTVPSGADLDRLNNKQLTPSHLAVSMGRLEAIRLLIQLGANVDKPGK